MNDCHSISNVGDIDQLILKYGVAINGFVNRDVEGHDLLNTKNIVPEAIHERRIAMEQAAESRHVVTVPGSLERGGCVFWRFHFT